MMGSRPLVERLHDRRFVATENPHGIPGGDTVFHYRLDGAAITGTYRGGDILAGHLVGRATSGETIELLYHCLTASGELLAGRSHGRLSLDEHGRILLDFDWAWTAGKDGSGRSRQVEFAAAAGLADATGSACADGIGAGAGGDRPAECVCLDADMRAVITTQRLCFAATVTREGFPNLSPKGTVRVRNDRQIVFCDIASPGTRTNLEAHPWMELNVVDTLSRRGYRFLGRASIHRNGEIFRETVQRITQEEGASYPVHGVVLLDVERIRPVVSPGYAHVPDERGMRAVHRQRRDEFDAEFERHIAARGPWRGLHGDAP